MTLNAVTAVLRLLSHLEGESLSFQGARCWCESRLVEGIASAKSKANLVSVQVEVFASILKLIEAQMNPRCCVHFTIGLETNCTVSQGALTRYFYPLGNFGQLPQPNESSFNKI